MLLMTFVVVSPPPVFAKNDGAPAVSGSGARDEAKIPYKGAESDGVGTAVRIIGVFLVVTLLAFVSIYMLKRFFPSFYVHTTGTTQHIRIIETRRLTPRTTLFLVELDGARMLLAQSGDQIVNLHKTSAVASDRSSTPDA
ncbi:MAG TPA: flagellar biosynthetic protein FliO [Burkholderiales bacterium]|nr:flagellar biosynthetic protein FliO [Burkholderiales bacterium]